MNRLFALWRKVLPLLACLVLAVAALGVEPLEQAWTVDGVRREALIYLPARPSTPAVPVVFVFHGHGGTMGHAARTMNLQALWPEAVVVYMQGLPTRTALVDPEGRFPGWQTRQGTDGDRDLHFFDAVLSTLERDFHADPRRIYATGHSNGGVFTYLLMATRTDGVAAYAPSGAIALAMATQPAKPKPVLHIAGQQDPLVRFDWQQRTMERIRQLNRTEPVGKPWGSAGVLTATLFPSQTGAPFIMALHPGGHQFPDGAAQLIVRFFKEQGAPGAF